MAGILIKMDNFKSLGEYRLAVGTDANGDGVLKGREKRLFKKRVEYFTDKNTGEVKYDEYTLDYLKGRRGIVSTEVAQQYRDTDAVERYEQYGRKVMPELNDIKNRDTYAEYASQAESVKNQGTYAEYNEPLLSQNKVMTPYHNSGNSILLSMEKNVKSIKNLINEVEEFRTSLEAKQKEVEAAIERLKNDPELAKLIEEHEEHKIKNNAGWVY